MLGMRPRIGSGNGAGALARALLGAAGLSLAAIAGGCMNSIVVPSGSRT